MPEARIAEILCSYGHDRMKTLPDGTSEPAPISDFERDSRAGPGRWQAKRCRWRAPAIHRSVRRNRNPCSASASASIRIAFGPNPCSACNSAGVVRVRSVIERTFAFASARSAGPGSPRGKASAFGCVAADFTGIPATDGTVAGWCGDAEVTTDTRVRTVNTPAVSRR